MLACGCAWLRSRFAPLTAGAASLLERCRLRRNAGLCLTRGMRGVWRGQRLAALSSLTMSADVAKRNKRTASSRSMVRPDEAGHAPFLLR